MQGKSYASLNWRDRAAEVKLRAEGEGGRRREYLDAHTALHSVLMLQPWETSPVNSVCEEPSDYMHNKHEEWQKAWELRCELEAH